MSRRPVPLAGVATACGNRPPRPQRRSGLRRGLPPGHSSSARQTVRAVQALQMGRASSIDPSGSGCSTPPSRHVTWTRERCGEGTIATWRTRHRRIRPPRGIDARTLESIGSTAICASGRPPIVDRRHSAMRSVGTREPVPQWCLGTPSTIRPRDRRRLGRNARLSARRSAAAWSGARLRQGTLCVRTAETRGRRAS